MISRKRFNKERLLSGTLLETLLLFLFIILAIASIYAVENNKLKEAINEDLIHDSDEVAVDSSIYNELLNKSKLFNNENIGEEELLKGLSNVIDSLRISLMKGVDPPPCILQNGNQRLLEIAFDPDTIFVIKTVNLENQIIRVGNWELKNNQTMRLNLQQFKSLGRELHESRRININDPFCTTEVNPKWYSSSYCYDCLYVVVVRDKISSITKPLKLRGLLSKKVTAAESRFMTSFLHNYFSLIFEK